MIPGIAVCKQRGTHGPSGEQWAALVMVITKELSFKMLEAGEKIPAKPWLWREWALSRK